LLLFADEYLFHSCVTKFKADDDDVVIEWGSFLFTASDSPHSHAFMYPPSSWCRMIMIDEIKDILCHHARSKRNKTEWKEWEKST
jgi:hypothetical protein